MDDDDDDLVAMLYGEIAGRVRFFEYIMGDSYMGDMLVRVDISEALWRRTLCSEILFARIDRENNLLAHGRVTLQDVERDELTVHDFIVYIIPAFEEYLSFGIMLENGEKSIENWLKVCN